jgi:hypothetical protein
MIIAFWIAVFCILWLLGRYRQHSVAKAAFKWLGPFPAVGETYAAYKFRWAAYSLGWLGRFVLVFGCIWVIAYVNPNVASQTWFMAMLFALSIGSGMAVLAVIGFLLTSFKGRLIGPNPVFVESTDASHQV